MKPDCLIDTSEDTFLVGYYIIDEECPKGMVAVVVHIEPEYVEPLVDGYYQPRLTFSDDEGSSSPGE